MKLIRFIWVLGVALSYLLVQYSPVLADDSCVFAVTANDVPPNIVLLMDNGAEMEQVRWHDYFNNSVDFTPPGAIDVVFQGDPATSTGFYNANGYSIYLTGNKYYLVPVGADLLVDTGTRFLGNVDGGVTPRWQINGRTIYLPPVASTVEISGAIDNAQRLRYSKNYLNWLFYSSGAGSYPAVSSVDDGTDLYSSSRFYWAKKALIQVMKLTENQAKFAIYYFTNDDGATQKQPLKFALVEPLAAVPSDNVLTSEFANNINGMKTADYSPLAEGLATIGNYYDSSNSHAVEFECQKSFTIIISPGVSSMDLGEKMGASTEEPDSLADYDEDGEAGGIGEGKVKVDQTNDGIDNDFNNGIDDPYEMHIYTVPTNVGGSTYLDDVADYHYTHDMVSYRDGFQNVSTYTIGFMGDELSNLFLKNVSNNGNGNRNLYDVNDPEYGKFHFEAKNPDSLAEKMQNAINAILEITNAFAAPVVPVTRTTSGDRLYMSFFTPRKGSNIWEGDVVKYGLNTDLNIVDKYGALATDANGEILESAEPYWRTINWANDATSDAPKPNGIIYSQRNIVTFLGNDKFELNDSANQFNNTNIDAAKLGYPVAPRTVDEIINFVRGADVFDADEDGITGENRKIITGDVLHSEPLVYEFIHSVGTLTLTDVSGVFQDDEILKGNLGGYARVNGTSAGSSLSYDEVKAGFLLGEVVRGTLSGATAKISASTDRTMIFFGSNDGMLHAVKDEDGTEAWGFVPPHQLPRLKDMIDGPSHQYYVDGSSKIFFKDLDGDGFITDMDHNGLWEKTDDQVIIVCGERKGSNGYFAIDITVPTEPKFLWLIKQVNDTFLPTYDDSVYPPVGYVRVVPELGESWSIPVFGKVKTSDIDVDGTDVMFIGGGYDEDNLVGKAMLAINVLDGSVVKVLKNGVNDIAAMDYSIPSQAIAIDGDENGFIEKVYVGDMGGRIWRFGKFTYDGGALRDFPEGNENINDWNGHILFNAGCNERELLSTSPTCTDGVDNNLNNLIDERRKFFYQPTVSVHPSFDIVYIGSGDRDNPCHYFTHDGFFVIKDNHSSESFNETDLVNAKTDLPDLAGNDNGWFYPLDESEKVLAESTLFQGELYFTTFTPDSDPCKVGGESRLYTTDYVTGKAIFDYDPESEGNEVYKVTGGGISSKAVTAISNTGDSKMLVSSSGINGVIIDTTDNSDGVKKMYYLWWKDMTQ